MSEIHENKEIINDKKIIKEDKLNIKLITICLSLFLLVGLFFSFTALSYKSLLKDFKNNFDSAHYSSANNILVTKGNLNLFKSFKINSDLTTYFNDKLNTVNTEVTNGKMKNDDALALVQEINRYNLLDSEIDKTVEVLSKNVTTSSSEISSGIAKFNEGKFKEALEIFKTIPSTHENFKVATDYIEKCKDGYINQAIQEADKLASSEYFSKGMTLLNEAINLVGNDARLTTKLDQLGTARDEYTAKINDN